MFQPITNRRDCTYMVRNGIIYDISLGNAKVECDEANHKAYPSYDAEAKTELAGLPKIAVTLTPIKDGKAITETYYLDKLIKDGDSYDGTAFTHCGKNFNTIFKAQVDEAIEELISNSTPVETIRRSVPFYCIKYVEGKSNPQTREGVEYKWSDVSGITVDLNDTAIETYIKTYVEDRANQIADKLLGVYGISKKGNTAKDDIKLIANTPS